MLDLLVTFKMCLGLVLLTGLVSGYLYTIFSSREEHQSDIIELEESIRHNREQTAALEKEALKLNETMQKEENEIATLDQKIQETEHNISTHKKAVSALQDAVHKLEEEYASVASIFKMQTERREQIKREIGDDTVSNLSQKIDEQQRKIIHLETEIEKESVLLNETQSRHNRISAQIEEFTTEKNKLQDSIAALSEKFDVTKAKAETIEEELQAKITSLQNEAEEWMTRIKKYKEILLKLRTSD